jgi:hypothetical protein
MACTKLLSTRKSIAVLNDPTPGIIRWSALRISVSLVAILISVFICFKTLWSEGKLPNPTSSTVATFGALSAIGDDNISYSQLFNFDQHKNIFLFQVGIKHRFYSN